MAPVLTHIARNINNYTAWPKYIGSYSSSITTAETTESVTTSTASTFTTAITLHSSNTPSSTLLVIQKIIPTITASLNIDQVRQGGETSTNNNFHSINKLGFWIYLLLVFLLLIFIGLSILMIYKCYTMGVNRTSSRVRNQSSLKKFEEGGRKKNCSRKRCMELDKDDHAKEVKKSNKKMDQQGYIGFGLGRRLECKEDHESWVDIELDDSSSQSQEWESEKHAEGVCELKINGSGDSVQEGALPGGESPSVLKVPGKVLLKDPRIHFPPGLDAFNIPYITPGSTKWENAKLSPIGGLMYK